MATATKIKLSPTECGIFCDELKPESAQVASEVLQEDIENHHPFFGPHRFHNHIVQHILTIYALGATPEEIKAAYERDKGHQEGAYPVDEKIVEAMGDKSKSKEFRSNEKQFPNFYAYFQREIDAKGVGDVLNEYLFAGDEYADDLLVRMFSGYLHPLIRLGFGVEFNQPAIVAGGLAEAAVHEDWVAEYLLPAEKAAEKTGRCIEKNLMQLLSEVRADEKLSKSAQWADQNKFTDGVMKRAPEEMIKYASEYIVHPDRVEEMMAQMINTVVYYTSSAQKLPKQVKFDFYFMHCVNSSMFFPAFLSLPFLSLPSKVRLLEWKGRVDLAMYVSRGSPKLILRHITDYEDERDWRTMFDKAIRNPNDDGHVSKMLRAIASGERVCRPFEAGGREKGFCIVGDMWVKIANLLIDSISGGSGSAWVRGTGFEEAWSDCEDISRM